MGLVGLQWDNTNLVGNPNAVAQRIGKRIKSVGGAFDYTGFSIANNLPVTANVVSATLVDNKVYEFRVEAICNSGGPIPNDNGLQEGIAFACIEPEITTEGSSATFKVDVAGTDISRIVFTVKTDVGGTVLATGTALRSSNTVEISFTGLPQGVNLSVAMVMRVVINGLERSMTEINPVFENCGNYPFSIPLIENFVFVAYEKKCIREGLFSVLKTISGLSSPLNTWYYKEADKVYVADADDPAGNVYWFDPDTAVAAGDMVHSAAVVDPLLYNNAIDPLYKRIYFVGRNTGGMLVYDIDSDTMLPLVPFGTNADFARTLLLLTEDYIYCNDANVSLKIYNRLDRSLFATRLVGSITTPAHFNNGPFNMIEVDGTLWVNANNGVIGTIGVYSMDLLTKITEITLTGVATWTSGRYWQTIYYDAVGQKVYVGDTGSSRRFVIDAATRNVLSNVVLNNREGKSNAQTTWGINSITGDLLCFYSGVNNSSDGAPIQRVYVQDRVTHQFLNMYENQSYGRLSLISGSDRVVGTTPGTFSWGGGAGYNTDGSITILQTSPSTGDKTGDEVTVKLAKADANNENAIVIPLETKDNVMSDPDYVPVLKNSPNCAPDATLDCPTDRVNTYVGSSMNFEFAIKSSVKRNPAIQKIRVSAYNTGTALIAGTPIVFNAPFDQNYFSGSVGALSVATYTMRIEYLGAADVVLQTCNS